MRTGLRILGRTIAAAALVASVVAPALAGGKDVLITPTGITFEAWDYRERTFGEESQEGISSIHYAVIDLDERREGIVDGTEDVAVDMQPRLAFDPATGETVLVWSRWDGVYQKLAYSRYTGSHWTTPMLLSFGPGDDTHPRIGTDSGGDYLFWVSKGDQYLYAPFDLSTGHLLSAGKKFNPSYSNDSSNLLLEEPDLSVEGGSDAPILSATTLCTPLPNGKCRGGRAKGPTPIEGPDGTVQGNSDVPIILIESQVQLWAVASHPGCRSQVVSLPADDVQSLAILSFRNGATQLISRIAVPDPIPDGYGKLAANSFLSELCN